MRGIWRIDCENGIVQGRHRDRHIQLSIPPAAQLCSVISHERQKGLGSASRGSHGAARRLYALSDRSVCCGRSGLVLLLCLGSYLAGCGTTDLLPRQSASNTSAGCIGCTQTAAIEDHSCAWLDGASFRLNGKPAELRVRSGATAVRTRNNAA